MVIYKINLRMETRTCQRDNNSSKEKKTAQGHHCAFDKAKNSPNGGRLLLALYFSGYMWYL